MGKLSEEIKQIKGYEFQQLKNEITIKVETLEKQNEQLRQEKKELRELLSKIYSDAFLNEKDEMVMWYSDYKAIDKLLSKTKE